MIVLDTQHVSQLQRAGSRDADRLESRLKSIPPSEARIPIVTPYEQYRAVLARIHAHNDDPAGQVPYFQALLDLFDYYATHWQGRILPFDRAAASILRGFDPGLKRRIGARDARIAAIALASDATLLTANRQDFERVPGLRIEDWLKD